VSFCWEVGTAEKEFLGSPRGDLLTVRRVLEFRDDLNDAMEASSDKCTFFLIAQYVCKI